MVCSGLMSFTNPMQSKQKTSKENKVDFDEELSIPIDDISPLEQEDIALKFPNMSEEKKASLKKKQKPSKNMQVTPLEKSLALNEKVRWYIKALLHFALMPSASIG